MERAKRILILALTIIAVGGISSARAQSYPDKVIKLVVPWPPGGLVDVLGRVLGQKMSDSLGQPIIVENRPGAGGNIGTDAVAKSPPDGYTLLVATSAHAMNASIYRTLAFDPVGDFTPIVLAARAASILVVNPSVPAKSLKELIALAQAKPGKLTYASAGIGTPAHLYAEMLKSRADIDIMHVPYKGAPPAMVDLLGGRVDMLFANMTVALPQIQSGKLRAIGITSSQRSPYLTDVPTLSESGLPGFDATQWLGILGPKSLPENIVVKLNAEANKALQAPDVKKALATHGMDVVGSTPKEFGDTLKADIARWSEVVKRAGVTMD